jgi:hypothetical protein
VARRPRYDASSIRVAEPEDILKQVPTPLESRVLDGHVICPACRDRGRFDIFNGETPYYRHYLATHMRFGYEAASRMAPYLAGAQEDE